MPLPQAGLDALWLCLRPAFVRLSRITPLSVQLTSNTPAGQKIRWFASNGDEKSVDYRSFFTSAHHLDDELPPDSSPKQNIHRVIVDSKERPHRNDLSSVNTELLYHYLRQASRHEDLPQVLELVKELVHVRGEKPNHRLYHATISANASPPNGSAAEVRRLLEDMAKEGLMPDSGIYHAALKVLAIHPDYLLRRDVLEEMRHNWFTLSSDGWHDYAAGLIRDRQIEMALETLEYMEAENIKVDHWLYDTAIYALCDIQEFDEALQLMRHRASNGELSISPTLWLYILDTASRALHHPTTLYAWRKRVETSYLNPPSGVCINVLNTAARHGDYRLATDVFRVLGNRSEVLELYHYESLLEAYVGSGDLNSALSVLTIMTSSGVPPVEASTRSILLHLRQSPDLPSKALSIVRDLHASDRPIPVPALNVIIEAYIHHDALPLALETYQSLHTFCPAGPTTTTFNILFRGCTQAARKDLAMFLAAEMVALKLKPDALIYDQLVLVCLSAEANGNGDAVTHHDPDTDDSDAVDDFEDAWKYFEEMRAFGWALRPSTAKSLAVWTAEKADRRVWELAKREGEPSGGLDMKTLEQIVQKHWPLPER